MKSENSTAQIKCTRYSSLHFYQSQSIHITNLEFIGCGGNQMRHIEEFVVKDAKFEGQEKSSTALELIETTAQIVSSIFISNDVGSYRECVFIFGPWNNCVFAGFIGGAIIATNSTVDITQSKFEENRAADFGGAIIFAEQGSIINISGNVFVGNNANLGGVLLFTFSSAIIEKSEFYGNNATEGVVQSFSSSITIEASKVYDNNASFGVLYCGSGTIATIEANEFHDNYGGVLYSSSSNIKIVGSSFTNNISPIGAIIYALFGSTIQHKHSFFLFDNNRAELAVIFISDSEFIEDDSGNATFSNNLGSLVASNSNITFAGYATFVNNQSPQTVPNIGGAITLLQSNILFEGKCILENNHAKNGGAIQSIMSKLYVNGDLTIAHNTATGNGGGIYLSNSELNCQQESTLVLLNNTAARKGGGLHAISSSIIAISSFNYAVPIMATYTGARINIIRNAAERGGGLSLEVSSNLHILKYDFIIDNDDTGTTIFFIANSADYGGAMHVDDDSNSGICASNAETECFFQVLALYSVSLDSRGAESMHFSQNHVNISGPTLYGGLLDRCTLSPFAEVYPLGSSVDGITYFKNVSTPTNLSVSSDPVRVCLCFTADQNNNCTHRYYIEVKKGQIFTLSVVAVDQVGQPVRATIQSSLRFTKSGLAEGQLARRIPAKCTDLTFNLVSPHVFETLSLYASDGPCNDAELSTATVEIYFLPCSCPIGLQISGMNSTNCTCECHSNISQYVIQNRCDSHTGQLIKLPQSRAWISYINDTDLTGYLVYPNCPFDYCLVPSPPLDLNQPNGADAQCAFNRSSLLCGSCQPGLSLSLGSSHCLQCPSYWPALLIAIITAAILAGMALVALLLVLNMTVAIGTLNGLIFYTNVLYANKNILLPFQGTNFITVFISWLNLELGFDTCFFPGMDTYTKTWLQLAFPIYVILLVIIVINISSYSTKFANLIGRKDPVATLATLILLSYAKLIDICFESLSVGILEYSDGSSEMLWLPDATVKYLSGKHIPLFIAAVLILLVGLIYAALLFSWQWLLYLPKWRIFKWSRNPKIQTFIETYHKPYTPKYRYWTGLLLIVRVILYLVAATNVSNDPTIALTAINFTVCCIFALKQFFGSRLYRKWPMDVLETFWYLNILSFVIFTWYSIDSPDSNREAAAYTSVIVTFIALLLIIFYHVYTYTSVFSKIHKTKLGKVIDGLITDTDPKPKPECHLSPPPDVDIHRFNELLDMIDRPVNTYDYEIPVKQQEPVKPTQSVVEVHQPRDLAAPNPEEVANSLHTPGAGVAVHIEVKEAVI